MSDVSVVYFFLQAEAGIRDGTVTGVQTCALPIFTGGEFVMTEQRPRMQSRAEVVPLAQGDAVVFAVNERPVRGTRGAYRVKLRHGVSRARSGRRYSAGIIFHDAA